MILLAASSAIEPSAILMGLFGGLALFLFGMDQMSDALKLVAGDKMKTVLSKLTTNRFTGAIAGAFVTSVIQSSSVTTVLVVGFISAGLLTVSQSIGIIMGANIGTTITAQIIAFKVTHYALALVAVGFAMFFCSKHEKTRHYGHMIMGLGLIFFGMQLMSDGTKPLRSFEPFIQLMQQMDRPIMAILVAAAFTGIVQSSSATTGIVIALASNGYISLEAGIALIFGANIGTCVTAVLAAVGKPREAQRAALVHIIFNIAGVVIWYGLIGQLADVVTTVSPTASAEKVHLATELLRTELANFDSLSAEEVAAAARRSAETPRQIANAHTIFNVANTFLLIWFTTPLAWLVQWLLPERQKKAEEELAKPRYLDDLLIQTPSLAIDIVRMEFGRLGAQTLSMVRRSLAVVLRSTEDELAKLKKMDNDVDKLHGAVVTYLGRLSKENLSDHQSVQLHVYLAAANYIENIADIVETNLVDAGRSRLKHDLTISDVTRDVLTAFHRKVCWSVEHAVRALVEDDKNAAQAVIDAKAEINQLADAAERHLTRRLSADEPNRLAAFKIESEIIEYLKRVFYFAKRIAKDLVADDEETYMDEDVKEQDELEHADA
ncbi:Na/Pi cotransporter family protein [Planctomycetota bacterium]